jgi:putative drug exporter of the RND superfamily
VSARYHAAIAAVARVSARHARLVVAVWVISVGLLGFVGRNVERDLDMHALFLKGTQTQRAHEIAVRQFGTDYTVTVLLQGPAGEVERQGRTLAARLSAMPRTLVMSPWVSGAARVTGLNPRPGVDALVVRVLGEDPDRLSGLLSPVRRRIDATVRAPVRVSVTGAPVLADSLRRSATKSSSVGDLIAIPILLFVLLFVFRSVLAALTPLLVGGCVVTATRGMVVLLDGVVQFDVFVIGLIGMMGLAIGVDYSLLVVSRFREERDKGGGPEAAVEATVAAAARSILPAGGALILAMLLTLILLSTVLVHAVAVAMIIATSLSMVGAVCVVPALLKLLGSNLERWSLPRRGAAAGVRLRWSERVRSRPGAVGAIVFFLLLLASLAFNLDSGVGSVAMLPAGDPGRQQQEDVERALGVGWAAPMEVVVNGRGSPITSSERLAAIGTFQRHVEADPGVASMTGLGPVIAASRKLGGVEAQLVAQEKGLERLRSGLSRTREGAAKVTGGLRRAARGSGELDSGIAATGTAAGGLAGGLAQASTGSGRLAEGLGHASAGSDEVARQTSRASGGLERLSDGLDRAGEETGEIRGSARLIKNAMRSGEARLSELHDPLRGTEDQLSAALAALRRMGVGRSDPEYAAALSAVEEASRRLTGVDPVSGEQASPSYAGVANGIDRAAGEFGVGLYLADQLDRNGEQASAGIGKLASSSRRLDRGLRRLAGATEQVSEGVAALSENGQRLSPAMRRLSQGAERLAGGLDLLGSGAGQLSSGLSESASKSGQLPAALRRMERGLDSQDGESSLRQIQRRSPGLFGSAYFVLASLDGTPAGQRAQLGSLIDVDRGGSAARLMIIPRDPANTDAAREAVERIEGDASGLARRTGMEVVVGGVAPTNIDLNAELRRDAPLMRIVLSLISLIVLVPLMRSLVIPVFAAIVNLLTVSASFGVMSLLFNNSLLGGPGYVDTTIVPATIIVMFGLAIDYEVFIFARIREEYLRTGSTRLAVENGLARTGPVVTGAAIIMILIFLAFSVIDVITIRNFAVAQAVGIFIDAFIVRLIVVPALMLWLDERCWWCPRWLDRILPGGGSAEDRADALAHGGG